MAIISSRPSAMLIKTRWRNKKGPRTLADQASVIGANLWRIALETYKHLEKDGFKFGSDRQVTTILSELIAFLVQMTDRLAHDRVSDTDRATLINSIAGHLAVTMSNNQLDLLGPGDYKAPFIAILNARARDYAEFEYTDNGPGYTCLRYLGEKVSDAMAASDNKWVIEQMVDVEAPEMMRLVKKLVGEVLGVKTP
jgi:hypothetical protein